ncbi:hypothetical protein EWB00_010531, partial [Schistosoma japonicum]
MSFGTEQTQKMQLYNMMNILTILLLNHLLQTKSQNDDIFEDNDEDGLEDGENLMDQSTTVPPSMSTFPTTYEDGLEDGENPTDQSTTVPPSVSTFPTTPKSVIEKNENSSNRSVTALPPLNNFFNT